MKLGAILLCLLFLFWGHLTAAYVASSTNYRVQSDSLNFGGGLSTSTNYGLESTGGEIATGESSSTNYGIKAGYQQMLVSAISISSPSDVSLGSLDGAAGGAVTGSVAWTVITDNAAGYTLTVRSSTNPALASGGASVANYTPAGATPDYTWSIAASASEFGFSPEGTDVVQRYLDNGSACNAGASNGSNTCWDAFSTSNTTVASGASGNSPAGTATTIKLQAEVGADNVPTAGDYSATIIATATAQ